MKPRDIGKIWKYSKTYSINTDEEKSWRETEKISSNCEVQEEFENISKLTRSAATEVASGERLRKFHETSRYRKNMKIFENLLYQHRRGEKLTRDWENFIELRGRERIWKCWTTDSIGYDGDCSCRRDSWRIFRRRRFWIGEILTEKSVKILQEKHFETFLSLSPMTACKLQFL